MKGKKFSSRIEKEGNALKVTFRYERTTTKEEEEKQRDYYQRQLSEETGKEVLRDEITVFPKAGNLYDAFARFNVILRESFSKGLSLILKDADYAFPLLIEDLRKYGREHMDQQALVEHAINGLEGIIGKEK